MEQRDREITLIRRTGWLCATVWTAVIVLGSGWNFLEDYDNTLEAARIQASGAFEKDLVYRRWAAAHGGVYVPVTEETPPNPYLSHIKRRDITTTSGVKLTLVNPAYMTRQVHELGREQYDHQGHITSLNPLRPENAPDTWEADGLRALERGETQVIELAKIGDTDYLRLIRPVITEMRCLKCHGEQGYKVGDLRGGISVSVPMEPLWTRMYEHMALVMIGYGIIWLLGLGGIGLGASRIGRRIRERNWAEAALQESEEKYRSMMEAMKDPIYICSPDYRVEYMNPAMIERVGHNATGEYCFKTLHDLNKKCSWCTYEKILTEGHGESDIVSPKDNRSYHISQTPIAHEDGSISKMTVYRDTTDFKKMEAQLHQAQKMESVGRLAGGVAHDYNNALSVIIGFTELAMLEVDPTEPLHSNLNQVLAAANRATDITRQLLAFARKQTITPKLLDLNENIESMLKMLRRLIGEDIDLTWLPGANLWPVKIDPSQVDQIMANLCVNARDAIGGVGKITIETENITFDEDYCAYHAGFVPGDFVLLAVSDNGSGIDKEILDNIFEPFFTTKDVDKGTGLGLAMVYGIAKQNNGFINVYSEPGEGTTIKIYLSRHEGKAVEIQGEITVEIPPGRGETLLLVEDDPSSLKLFGIILDELGYIVLTAGTPGEAMGLAEKHAGEIHLLITDVIMPEMNGRELAERLHSLCPELKRMFMSGYTANVIAHHGVLDEGVNFIQKPFSKRDLAKTVRKALDG